MSLSCYTSLPAFFAEYLWNLHISFDNIEMLALDLFSITSLNDGAITWQMETYTFLHTLKLILDGQIVLQRHETTKQQANRELTFIFQFFASHSNFYQCEVFSYFC